MDLQLYRYSCRAAVNAIDRLWVVGLPDVALAVYGDGSATDERRLNCFRGQVATIGNRLFVFKWKNEEHWLSSITRPLWDVMRRLRASQTG